MDTLGIAGIGDKFPAQLSGGQQQRVGLARALARLAFAERNAELLTEVFDGLSRAGVFHAAADNQDRLFRRTDDFGNVV